MDRTRDYEHDRRRHAEHDLDVIRRWAARQEQAFWDMVREDSCPECHGTGFADENRPCEHP